MNRIARWIIGIALVGGLGFLAVRSLFYQPLPVEMRTVEVMTVREYVTEDGKTRLDETFLVDMPFPGTIERIELDFGDEVTAGQCVANVDTFQLEQQIKSTEALLDQVRAQIDGVDVAKPKEEDLETGRLRIAEMSNRLTAVRKERDIARINYEEAQKNRDRAQKLFDRGGVSQAEYEEAKRAADNLKEAVDGAVAAVSAGEAGLRIAELSSKRLAESVDDNEFMRESFHADIARIEAQLEAQRKDLEKAVIKSPVDGVILEKYVEDRRVLMAGTPLMRVGNLSTIEIESDILSEEVVRVEVGDAVEITGKAFGGDTIMGRVKRIYPAGFMKISALGIEQQRVRTIIEFDNSEVGLRPGTSVDVRVITNESEDATAVPERATFRYEDGWAVFTVEGKRSILTKVDVGVKNDDWAEIVKGVEPGDTIVAEPKNEMEDGTAVTPL